MMGSKVYMDKVYMYMPAEVSNMLVERYLTTYRASLMSLPICRKKQEKRE